MGALHLSHDVIDSQLVDRHKEKIGRVDELLLELEEGKPPRVATIVIGGRRAHAGSADGWSRSTARCTRCSRHREEHVSRIPFASVRCIADTIELDVDGSELASMHVEHWLAKHVVCRIPGAGGERK